MKRFLLSKAARVGAAVAASSTGLALTAMVNSTPAAHADPSFSNAKQGAGSDTIQDVLDAYAGESPFSPSSATHFYTALESGSGVAPGSGSAAAHVVIASWDAIPLGGSASNPGTIITHLGGPAFDRPNGSSNGIKALNAANGFGPTGACGTGANGWEAPANSSTKACVNIPNQLDFARASRGPNTAGTNLTFIPFARDAVTYAYFVKGTANISTLTTAQLNTLYSNGTSKITVGSDTVVGCLPQSGSGTHDFFLSAIGLGSSAQLTAADNGAKAAGCYGVEENGANTFETTANGFAAGTDAIIPFSAGSWLSQLNGVAVDRSSTGAGAGVHLGDPDSVASPTGPLSGTAPNLTENIPYYENNQWGRDVFIVVPTANIDPGSFTQDADLWGLFGQSTDTVASFGPSPSIGTGPAICSSAAQTTANHFGFASLDNVMTTKYPDSSTHAVPCGDAIDDRGNV